MASLGLDQTQASPLGQDLLLFDLGPVAIWVRGGVIHQIGVRSPYRGLIGATDIGIGSTLRELSRALGVVVEDDEDNLVVQGVSGLCIETERWYGWPGREAVEDNLDARITEIFVLADRAPAADLDPFRTPGSPYEHEEVFVIGLVAQGSTVDWAAGSVPVRSLWLPESFFRAFHKAAVALDLPLLSTLDDPHAQYRFGGREVKQVAMEFESMALGLPEPLAEAAALASLFVMDGINGELRVDVILEGP